MKLYLDTSVIVSLFVEDTFSARADELARQSAVFPLVSDFAAAEFVSAVAALVRRGTRTLLEARGVLAAFDSRFGAGQIEIKAADIRLATAYVRRLDLTLKAPDAIHIAAAYRLGAELATFDTRMAASASILGVAVASI